MKYNIQRNKQGPYEYKVMRNIGGRWYAVTNLSFKEMLDWLARHSISSDEVVSDNLTSVNCRFAYNNSFKLEANEISVIKGLMDESA